MIRLTVDFRDAKKFDQLIRYIENNAVYEEAKTMIRELGHKTADNMGSIINSYRKRPSIGTNKLEKSITSVFIAGVSHSGFLGLGRDIFTHEVGIGEIAKMNREAPYWEVLDVGGYVPPANLGYFGENNPPIPGGKGEAWIHTGRKEDFLMTPKSPIEGLDYIGQSLRKLKIELDEGIKELGAKFINGAQRESK